MHHGLSAGIDPAVGLKWLRVLTFDGAKRTLIDLSSSKNVLGRNRVRLKSSQ